MTILSACLGFALQVAPVELKPADHKVDVIIAGQPFTTYDFSDVVAKPYLMPLRTASGIVISRSFPVVNTVTPADQKKRFLEPHQRPLYFSHGNIDGLNFWAEQAFHPYYHGHARQAYGRMSFTKLENVSSGSNAGALRARFNLLAPSGRVIREETQSFKFQGDDLSFSQVRAPSLSGIQKRAPSRFG